MVWGGVNIKKHLHPSVYEECRCLYYKAFLINKYLVFVSYSIPHPLSLSDKGNESHYFLLFYLSRCFNCLLGHFPLKYLPSAFVILSLYPASNTSSLYIAYRTAASSVRLVWFHQIYGNSERDLLCPALWLNVLHNREFFL